MAFYLSIATHDRLKQREDLEPALQEKGLMLTNEFTGQLRCVEVASGAMPDFTVWTGDIDGEITVRKGLVGKPMATIPRRTDAFVFCMARYGHSMWCGYSDGWIIVYDIRNRKVITEVKGHCGAVNCMLSINGFIFSGGTDWQICQWDPIAMSKRPTPHGQLSGHQNAVRCLTTDGSFLYSGGDDWAIRCWDLDTAYERAAPWPIMNHGDSVRAICLSEAYLFSSSSDGTVKVWNTQTAQLVRELDSEDTAVNTLAIDGAGSRVWAGTTGGQIRVWDANTLNQVAMLHEHHETHVPLVKSMARVNAVKAWTIGADEKIRIWYSDNEANEIEFQELADMECGLQELVEQHRVQVIENFRELECSKDQVKGLEASDHNRKVALANVLGRRNELTLQRSALARVLRWHERRQYIKTQTTAAQRMADVVDSEWMRRGYKALATHCAKNKTERQRVALSKHLLERHEKTVTKQYLENLREAVRRRNHARKQKIVSSTLALVCEKGIMMSVFHKWYRLLLAQKAEHKRKEAAARIHHALQDTTVSVYWSKLLRFVRNERQRERTMTMTLSFASFSDASLRLTYFRKLQNKAAHSRVEKDRARTMVMMMQQNDRGFFADTFNGWARVAKHKRATAMKDQVSELSRQCQELETDLEGTSDLNDEQLEEKVREKQMELATLLAETEELDDEILELEEQQKKLSRELLKDITLNNDQPKADQLVEALHFLKARGVNAFHDREEVAKAREAAKTTSAETVYEQGITEIRKVCAKAIKPEKLMEKGESHWYIGEMFETITPKTVAKACVGIIHMVTAFDMLNIGQVDAWLVNTPEGAKEEWAPKYQHNEEVLNNFSTILEFAIRQYRTRRNEDPVTGEPLSVVPQKKTRRSSDAVNLRGRSTEPKPKSSSPVTSEPPKKTTKRSTSAPAGSTAKKSLAPKKKTTTSANTAALAPPKKKKAAKSTSPAPKKKKKAAPSADGSAPPKKKKTKSASPGTKTKKKKAASPSPGAATGTEAPKKKKLLKKKKKSDEPPK